MIENILIPHQIRDLIEGKQISSPKTQNFCQRSLACRPAIGVDFSILINNQNEAPKNATVLSNSRRAGGGSSDAGKG